MNFEIPLELDKFSRTIHFTVTPYIEGRQQGSTASQVPCEDTRVIVAWRLSGCDNLDPHSASSTINNLDFFDSVPSPIIKIIGIPYTIGSTTIVPGQFHYDLLMSWLQRVYPSSQILGGTSTDSGTGYVGTPTCQQVNTNLYLRWITDVLSGPNPNTRYIGLVSDNSGANFMRGCSVDMPFFGNPIAAGPVGSTISRDWGWDFDGSYGDWYGGHEIAHTYGRNHPGFADTSDGNCTRDDSLQGPASGSIDENYPYPDGLISGANRHFGFDVGDPSNSISPNVKDPLIWTDVMTYRCFEWISDYTYKGIMNKFRSQDLLMTLFDTSSSYLSQLPQTAKQSNLTLFVFGNLNLNKSYG